MSAAPPIGGVTVRQAAASMNVSVRSVERARRILEFGAPELITMTEAGALKLGPAETVAMLPHDLQRQACAQGAAFVRQLADTMKRDTSAATPARSIPELRTQLDRAIYDLEHGWPEAAYDVLVRARDHLVQEQAP